MIIISKRVYLLTINQPVRTQYFVMSEFLKYTLEQNELCERLALTSGLAMTRETSLVVSRWMLKSCPSKNECWKHFLFISEHPMLNIICIL